MSEEIIYTFPSDPDFHVNCTHLAEELIRRLKSDNVVIMEQYGDTFYDENREEDIKVIAETIKAILR